MEYHSEFEIVETINSSITKKRHQYSHFYRVWLADDPAELHVYDLRTNHGLAQRTFKSNSRSENKLELAYALYTETGIHPLHLFFFHDIPRDLWKGFLCGRNHKLKLYHQFEWHDLLYPLPFYPNLEGFCHAREVMGSCDSRNIRKRNFDEITAFSLEWTLASLERYSRDLPRHDVRRNTILIATKEAISFTQRKQLEVVS